MGKALAQHEIENLLLDIRNEPEWRAEADRCADYYDGNQLDGDTMRLMRERGMAPLIRNVIAPAIDLVLGMEAKNRQDFKVLADEETDTDEALALNKLMHEAERLSVADQAISEALAGQLKAGLGWVEVGQARSPWEYPHQVRSIHRREMFWDWRAREMDLSDARYVVRRRWFDPDVLAVHFPQHKRLIEGAGNGWAAWDWDAMGSDAADLGRSFDAEMRSSLEASEWRDADRRRLAVYEVRYRVYRRGVVMRLHDEQVVEFDKTNPRHLEVVAAGMAALEEWPLADVRIAFWLGPHPLMDIPSPFSHRQFGYIPFWGLREDRTGIPYGLIRRMLSPQDEVNARLSKMMFLLSARRVEADTDAFAIPWEKVRQEVAKPNAMIPLNPDRRNKQVPPKIEHDRDMSAQQWEVLQQAMAQTPELAGIYRAMMGMDTEAKSGVAIAGLVEQGATTMAEIMDNHRFARKSVGTQLLANVVDAQQDRLLEVEIERGRKKIIVAFNRPDEDPETGERVMTNALMMLKTRVDLADVPQSPVYKAQRLNQLQELVKTLPDHLQEIVLPIVIAAMDLPDKERIVEALEAAIGGGDSPADVLEQQRQQAMAQHQAQQQLEEGRAKLDGERAETEKTRAETEKLHAQVREILHQLAAIAAQPIAVNDAPAVRGNGGEPVAAAPEHVPMPAMPGGQDGVGLEARGGWGE